jgi:hypothetical protein
LSVFFLFLAVEGDIEWFNFGLGIRFIVFFIGILCGVVVEFVSFIGFEVGSVIMVGRMFVVVFLDLVRIIIVARNLVVTMSLFIPV